MDYVRSQSLSTNNKESKKDLEKIFKVPNLMKIKKEKSKSKKTFNPISDNNKVISQSLKLNEQAIIKPIIKGRNNKTLLLNQSPRSKLRYSMNLKTNLTILSLYKNTTNKGKKIRENKSISINNDERNIENNYTTINQQNLNNNSFKKRNITNKKIIRYKSLNNRPNKKFEKYFENENKKKYLKKIVFIQRWWRTISCIILIQKTFRGYIYRYKNIYKFKIKVNKKTTIKNRKIQSLIHRINIGKKLLNSSHEYKRILKIPHNFAYITNDRKIRSYSTLKSFPNTLNKININDQFIITSQYNFSIIDKEKENLKRKVIAYKEKKSN